MDTYSRYGYCRYYSGVYEFSSDFDSLVDYIRFLMTKKRIKKAIISRLLKGFALFSLNSLNKDVSCRYLPP